MDNNNKNDLILNSLAEGVITVDKNFKITFFNDAAEKSTVFEREKVIGNICKNIFKSAIVSVLQNGKNVYDI